MGLSKFHPTLRFRILKLDSFVNFGFSSYRSLCQDLHQRKLKGIGAIISCLKSCRFYFWSILYFNSQLIESRRILIMENYNADVTITHEIEDEPFDKAITRVYIQKEPLRRYVSDCIKILTPGNPIVLVAEGKLSTKAVGCTEILKAKKMTTKIHQINRVTYVRTKETYEPLLEGLEPLRVTRSIPVIHILLSMEPLDETALGYQKTVGDGRKYGKKTVSTQMLQDCS